MRDLARSTRTVSCAQRNAPTSSPSTLVQMFLLWRYQVATMDRRSFGSIGAEDQHYLRISIATALDDLRIALDRISVATTDVDGFQQFIQEGTHLC